MAAAVEKGLTALGLEETEATITIRRKEAKGFLGLGRKTALVEVEISAETVARRQAAQKKIEKEMRQNIRTDAQNDPQRRSGQPAAKASAPTPASANATAVKSVTPAPAAPVARPAAQPAPAPVATAETENRNDEQAVKDLALYLTDLTQRLGAPSLVRIDRQSGDRQIVFHLDTAKEGLLIGKHGRSINSLQYISQTFFNHRGRTHQAIVLNVGDYRERRERVLASVAKRTARNVIADHQAVYLDPMPSFERKQIHTLLADSPYVETYSEGVDPERYVVVVPRKTVKLP